MEAQENSPFRSDRRELSKEEGLAVWNLIAERWQTGQENYWFPLCKQVPRGNVIAFHDELWKARDGFCVLERALIGHGIHRCFALAECGPSYGVEIAVGEISQFWNHFASPEQYITTDGDWLVYLSHESSIALAGWVAGYFQSSWHDAANLTYQGPFHTDDLRGTWGPHGHHR